MTQSNTLNSALDCTPTSIHPRSFSRVPSLFTEMRTALIAGVTVAVLTASTLGAHAQAASSLPDPATQSAPADTPAAAPAQTPAAAPADSSSPAPQQTLKLSNKKPKKTRVQKEDKVVATKDTKKEVKNIQKNNSLATADSRLPDKQLYDKAEDAIKHGRFDVGRLDLQTLLNTYPESEFMMRAKLAIADSWYKEGGTAALTQAEQEYKDFITFFPNAPEAAEAQMRVGDIYFRQMDKPDRDYAKTVQAENEYRLMLQQFPDSPLVPQAQQRLREVQETLASREANIATFYAERTPPDWPGAIARFQTVVDTYPLYSHMDDVLIGLGDSYEAEAKYVRAAQLPEAAKARLEKIYDDRAAADYREVVLKHSAAPHVEDAKDRLVGMGLPIPTPTPEEVAASEALENSRGQYTLSKRATLIFLHQADTVPAATVGNPPLADAKPTLAPNILRQANDDFKDAMNPSSAPRPGTPIANAPADAAAQTPAAAAAPLALQSVPTDNGATGTGSSATVTDVQEASPSSSSPAPGGASMGIEIVQPAAGSAPATAPATPPVFPGTAAPADGAPRTAPAAVAPESQTGGITPVRPPDATPLPAVQKADSAPNPINEVTPGSQPPAQAAPADGKKSKVAFDKSDESSSKHKKKKGLGKLNPF